MIAALEKYVSPYITGFIERKNRLKESVFLPLFQKGKGRGIRKYPILVRSKEAPNTNLLIGKLCLKSLPTSGAYLKLLISNPGEYSCIAI
ncbi:hypothetical protein LR004_01515 [Candidatus Gracilibacteria bacterium]|nr:hypothetical protein [Candidatus Gracilibacteria bacterium]